MQKTFVKVFLCSFINAIIVAFSLFILGLANDYFVNKNIRTFVPVVGTILGFLVGGVIGGIIGLINPNPKKAIYITGTGSTIYILIILALKSKYLLTLFDEGSYVAFWFEIFYLIGFGISLVFAVWVVSKFFLSTQRIYD